MRDAAHADVIGADAHTPLLQMIITAALRLI